MTDEVKEAFYALCAPRMPLRIGKDRLFASPDAHSRLKEMFKYELMPGGVIFADPNLTGVEMRLESRCF